MRAILRRVARVPGRRRRLSGRLSGLFGALLLVALIAIGAALFDSRPTSLSGIAHAADGDSLEIDGLRVRLLGIDAPELQQTCGRTEASAWPCGRQARDRLAALVAGQLTHCNGREHDRYGRLLADCRSGGHDLAATMVVEGWAISRPAHAEAERAARETRRGIWRGPFDDPRDWRDRHPSGEPSADLLAQLWAWLGQLTGASSLR